MSEPDYTGLQVAEDMRIKRWSWRGEVIQYIALALLLAAGLLGVFGSGPLSRTKASSRGGGVVVEYERFQRIGAPARLHVRLAAIDGDAALRFDPALLKDWEVEAVSPEPSAVRAAEEGVTYSFDVADDATDVRVDFRLLPETFGMRSLHLAGDSDLLQLDFFVYP